MVTAFSKCLRSTNQKFSHKILGKVMKFQPLTVFKLCTKKTLGGGGGHKVTPGSDGVKVDAHAINFDKNFRNRKEAREIVMTGVDLF